MCIELAQAIGLSNFSGCGQESTRDSGEFGKVLEILFITLVLSGLTMRFEIFLFMKASITATNFTELRKRLQNFHESTVQGYKERTSGAAVSHLKTQAC